MVHCVTFTLAFKLGFNARFTDEGSPHVYLTGPRPHPHCIGRESHHYRRRVAGVATMWFVWSRYRDHGVFMTTPQERKRAEREARRRRIQGAARPIFVERGFAATSIEQIARQAEMSVGAIYLYFQSKEDLYVSLLPEAMAPLEAALAEHRSGSNDARLTAAWDQLLAWSRNEAEGARALGLLARPGLATQLSPEAASGAAEAITKVKEQLSGAIQDGITAGTYRHADAAAVAELVWSTFLGGLTLDLVATNLGQPVVDRNALIGVVEASLRADVSSMRRAA